MARKRRATPAQLRALAKARRARKVGGSTYKQKRAAAHARNVKRIRGGRRRRGRGIGDWVRKGINFGKRVYSTGRHLYDNVYTPLSKSKVLSNTADTLASVGLPGASMASQGFKYLGLGGRRRRRRGGARVALNVGLLPR